MSNAIVAILLVSICFSCFTISLSSSHALTPENIEGIRTKGILYSNANSTYVNGTFFPSKNSGNAVAGVIMADRYQDKDQQLTNSIIYNLTYNGYDVLLTNPSTDDIKKAQSYLIYNIGDNAEKISLMFVDPPSHIIPQRMQLSISNFSAIIFISTSFPVEQALLDNLKGDQKNVYTFSAGATTNNGIVRQVLSSLSVASKYAFTDREIDGRGIPLVNYHYVQGQEIGLRRNPLTIAHEVWSLYAVYLTKADPIIREHLVNNADWLVKNAKSRGNFSLLEYDFQWPAYNLAPPWRSAMAQADASRALVMAHKVTGNTSYLDTAAKLLRALFINVSDGGVTYKSEKDGWWYELYAKNGTGPKVANGMMAALLSIYYYYNYTHSSEAKVLFDQGLVALKNKLPIYDDPKFSYSYYDAKKTTNTYGYHRAHVQYLGELYNLTKIPIFKLYHDKWENFVIPPYLLQGWKTVPQVTFLKSSEDNISMIRENDSYFRVMGSTNRSPVSIISLPFAFRAEHIIFALEDNKVMKDDESKLLFDFGVTGRTRDYDLRLTTSQLTSTDLHDTKYNYSIEPGSSTHIDLSGILGYDYLYVNRLSMTLPANQIIDMKFKVILK